MVGLGRLPGATVSTAFAVSGNGQVVAGDNQIGTTFEAFRWTQATGMVGLGFLPGGNSSLSRGNTVSADGSVVVGSSNSAAHPNDLEATRWTPTGVAGLGFLPGRTSTQATGVSADGSVVVG